MIDDSLYSHMIDITFLYCWGLSISSPLPHVVSARIGCEMPATIRLLLLLASTPFACVGGGVLVLQQALQKGWL